MKKELQKKLLKVSGIILLGTLLVAGIASNKSKDEEIRKMQEFNNKILTDYIVEENFAKFKKEEQRLENLTYSEDMIAFCFQKSEITIDGSIKNPLFFGKLSNKMKNYIVDVKDHDKVLLSQYLNRKIDIENQLRCEAEFKEVLAEVNDLKRAQIFEAKYSKSR